MLRQGSLLGVRPLLSRITIRRHVGTFSVLVLAVVAGLGGAQLLTGGPMAAPATAAPPSAQASAPVISSPAAGGSAAATLADLLPLPDDLADMAWVAFDGKAYVAGTLGAGATFTLPSGEIGLDARDSLVLSTDAAKSTLILRDLVSGAVVAERKTGLTIDNGIIWEGQVYVSARTADGSADAGVLGGSTQELSLRQVLPAVAGGPDIGETRGPVKVSPTGTTVGSTVCTTMVPCLVQSRNLASGVITTIDDYYLRWISDEVAVLGRSLASVLSAYALGDGKFLGSVGGGNEVYGGFFLSDGDTLIFQDARSAGDLVAWRVSTGRLTDIETRGATDLGRAYLIGSLSTETRAVLLSVATIEAALRDGASMTVVDLDDWVRTTYQGPFAGDNH